MTYKPSLVFSVLILCSFGILFSCGGGEDDAKPKIEGCTNELSLNFNEEATHDDGSCDFPADKLIGEWQVTEEVDYFNATTFQTTALPTAEYTATIVSSDEITITLTTDRVTTPVYIYQGTLTVDWVNSTVDGPGTIEGDIESENSFTVSYSYGTSTGVHFVDLMYERIP